MIEQNTWNIILLADTNSLNIPEKLGEYCLNATRIDNPESFLEAELSVVPDMVLVQEFAPPLRSGDLIFKIKKKWEVVPIVLILKQSSLEIIKEIFSACGFDYIREEFFQEDLYAIILKHTRQSEENEENKFLVKNLSNLITYLQEKNVIFKTIVELITHDTRNQFYYISTVINQIQDRNLKDMLDNAVHELNECIQEAYGYLNEKRRISSAVSVIENLRLEKKRVLLKNHPRIRFTHAANYILFIEVSSLFKNAISNILENALKYSPEANPVQIEVARDVEDVIIRISDQGPGISDDEKKRIFEWNFRLQRDLMLDGTGKGLWITKNIVEKERGRIDVYDNEGGGTVFEVRVPVFKIDDFKKAWKQLSEWFDVPPLSVQHKIKVLRTFLNIQNVPAEYDMDSMLFANLVQLLREENLAKKRKYFYMKLAELKNLNPEGKSVLVIDDSIHVHYYLAAHLTEIGYRIAGFATNGADGVSYYELLKPDLVTMDSTMPIMSGTEAAIEIVKLNTNARILFVTGIGEHPRFVETLKKSIPQENFKIIKKPFKKEEIEAVLKDFCV